jgi:pimeloyl-ACP methyl ester carboxylesterase
MEQMVEVGAGDRVWARAVGPDDGSPVLLVMGANASSATWPEAFVAPLAEHHRVLVYDHRDTGRSTTAFAARPYAIRDQAEDAVRVLDAFAVDRAHVVGMSMGGILVQLLLADHPDRVCSATLFCTTAVGSGLAAGGHEPAVELPAPDPRLLALWAEMGQARSPEEELAWRVEHWRLLNGDELPFDPAVWRALEQRVMDHAGRSESSVAHALADASGLERPGLRATTVPTLVIEAPADPINPPPHSAHLAASIGSARLVTIPGMGHALHPAILDRLVALVLEHTTAADRSIGT